VHFYPQPGKPKAQRIAAAFAEGCGGKVMQHVPRELEPGPAAFYGVRPAWLHLWLQAKAEGREWWYVDNAYFDAARERCFRVVKNGLQHDGRGESDGKRLARLGVAVKPWRQDGEHVLVCVQSDEFLRVVAGVENGAAGWLVSTLRELSTVTTRPALVRVKRDSRPLAEDMEGAWAVVTYSSAAANEALLAGIPVSVGAGAALDFSTPLRDIDNPRRPDGRERWAAVLADQQWTLSEIAGGAVHGR
jgi:hypothetical protein